MIINVAEFINYTSYVTPKEIEQHLEQQSTFTP